MTLLTRMAVAALAALSVAPSAAQTQSAPATPSTNAPVACPMYGYGMMGAGMGPGMMYGQGSNGQGQYNWQQMNEQMQLMHQQMQAMHDEIVKLRQQMRGQR